MIKTVSKLLLTTTLISGLWGLTACQQDSTTSNNTQSDQEKILRTAHSSWIEEHFQTEIVKIGLEKLGYTVEKPKELDYPALYITLAQGDLDYSVVYYTPSHESFAKNAGGEEKLQAIGNLTNGQSSYLIDKKTADKYNITSIEQLKDPKIAKLFDSDNDGKANLVGCNAGWACELIIDNHIENYGLTDTVEHNRGQYIALLADSITRYKQGESILFFGYNPHWINAELKLDQDVVRLEVPFTSMPEKLSNITEEDTTVNGKNLGFSKVKQRLIANKQFLDANPIAKRWFELVQIPAEDINAESLRIKQGENKPEDIKRHAQEWVANNQETFDRWIQEVNDSTK